MKFETILAEELIEEISMGPFGSNIKKECFTDTGVAVLNGRNLIGYALNEDSFGYITEEKADSLGKANASRGDVIITHRGTLGQAVFIPQNSTRDRYVISQSQFRIRCNEKILPEYMVYYLHTPLGQHKLLANASQVGVPALGRPTSTFKTITIDVPDVKTQKVIVEFLELLRLKIENNNRINRNLEEQAKTLYKHMIIEVADAKWKDGILSDIAIIIMGQSPKGDTYNEDGKGKVFYQGRGEFGNRFPNRRLYTTEPKRMAEVNDVLMSVRAPVGDLNVAYEKCCIGRGLGAIRSKDNHQSFVLYTAFYLQDALNIYNGEGTIFGSINKDSLNRMSILIPPANVIDEFEKIASNIDRIVKKNYEENCRLIDLRDLILPKLMSGDLDVSTINI